jgi:pilus assembly protein Flp/PilA
MAALVVDSATKLTWPQFLGARVSDDPETTPVNLRIRSNRSVDQGELAMKNLFARFAKDESGATAIEYGLIAALISVVIIAVLTAIGTSLNTKFNSVKSGLG